MYWGDSHEMHEELEYGEPGERTQSLQFEMPAPTLQPLLLALGLMLIFAGLILYHPVSYLGALLAILAVAGWWRTVVPEEAHELLPLDQAHRPEAILPSERIVAHLKPGDAQHAIAMSGWKYSYFIGVPAGLAAGGVMAALACLYGLVAQRSIWFSVNLLAGVVLPNMGAETVDQLRSFNAAAFLAALFGHVSLSVLVGILYAVALPMFPKRAVLWAGILVPLVWTGFTATLLNLINPALNTKISWPWFIGCQLAFGLVCGFIVARKAHIQDVRNWTLAERASLEAPGVSKHEEERP
jgi:hypothetical protein